MAELARRAGDLDAVRAELQKAAAFYRGDLLLSCYSDWVFPIRERLRQQFIIIAADKAIPQYAKTISNHRPVMVRLHVGQPAEEGPARAGIPTPDWLML